jgi:tetratricopeptide (TPR) repeat protein
VLLKKTLGTIVAIAALALGLAAQDKQKNWKDMAEYDLFMSIQKDTNAATRLPNLDKWKSAYPQSEYADVRLKAYLITYQQLMKHREAFDTALEILKTDPNDQASLQEILGYIRALIPQQAAALSAQNKTDLDTAGKTSAYVLSNIDTVYAKDKKPQGVTDAQWEQAKPAMKNFAQWTIGWIAMVEKDTPKAESELSKTLDMDPTNAMAAQQLAGILLAQQKEHPDKTPLALFEYARVATYDSPPNALPADQRQKLDAFLTKAYTTFHGSAQGLDQLKAMAKTNALPPAGFKIDSVVDIANKKAADDDAAAKANPMLAFWRQVKDGLIGDGSAAYWEAMNGSALPGSSVSDGKFRGKLISATPETRPNELKLAIEDPMVADVTLKLAEPLPGKMDPGGEIAFSGVAKDFAKSPFMVTFEVEKEDISGWTGKGLAGAGRAGGKKAAPKKKE